MRGLRNAWREAKNIANGYSDIQAKLRDATSVDCTGPTTGQLQEIASATNHSSFMTDLIYIFNKRLNDHGKYWRHVYKTLVVLEFCVIFGSEGIVQYAKDSIYTIKTLKEFIHIDDQGRDKGILVREKSKDLVELLSDELLLAQCRSTGQFPNYTRPKSAEPILVDPKQRKRLGGADNGKDNNFFHLQDVDENEAMRMALTASRSDNSRYQSLELDEDSDSSEDDNTNSNRNPFSIPALAISYSQMNPFAIEANNPFSSVDFMAVGYQNQNLMIENPFNVPQIETSFEIPQIEYNEGPFIPRPDAFNLSTAAADNCSMAAKPVGPHTSAPQFSYSKQSLVTTQTEENPFDTIITSEAQNSPHFNLQK